MTVPVSRRAALTAAVAALVVPAAHASGAAVVLTGASPANGTVLPTQVPPYSVTLEWQADTAGCTGAATAELVVVTPTQTLTSGAIPGNPPSGSQTFTASPQARTEYRWYVVLRCASQPEIRSEERTFTFTGPDPSPRLSGRYTVSVAGNLQTWTFTPRCATGACATTLRRPGARPAVLAYDAARRTYRGTVPLVTPARERICVITRTLNGVRVSRRTFRGVYSARNADITLSIRLTGLSQDSTRTLAERLVGTQRARYQATARGRRLGCPSGSTAVATLQLARRG
jgi:hypothetical protein